ncbi:hypothetical protein PSMK_00840 [Phycisphaera mikurensis NBRC 102666]|uniref:Fic/DOC N-terminal domain-containing protein n=1 Tax=Phycisphaera mikurensis (strain NBRC 102666 / KCTC 22515 / FYK2301M01) TaxID=1142394 RepID=I0IAF5_PHYMF|nr:hypothetical protein PSMK_00840 [Phycisphaera mikurensis NBRC 102666]
MIEPAPWPHRPSRTPPGRAGASPRAAGTGPFCPAPCLPPAWLSGRLQERLSVADHAPGRLDGSITTLPHPDFLVFMHVRKEAVLSSQIEGTQSSLRDALSAEASI